MRMIKCKLKFECAGGGTITPPPPSMSTQWGKLPNWAVSIGAEEEGDYLGGIQAAEENARRKQVESGLTNCLAPIGTKGVEMGEI